VIRRVPAGAAAAAAATAAVLLATPGPAAAHNCGSLADCLPSGRGLLTALAAVLIVVGLAILISAFPPAGGLVLAGVGGGVATSAGAISVSTAAAGITTVGAGIALATAAEGMPSGGSGGSGGGGSGSGGSGGPQPPAQPPNVSDPRLGNIVRDLYKGTTNPNRVGNGTTMDAIRHELATGQATSGRMHLQKGREYVNALTNWLRRNPNASAGDRSAAQQLLDDLTNALAGN
jgi:hypothetical protein